MSNSHGIPLAWILVMAKIVDDIWQAGKLIESNNIYVDDEIINDVRFKFSYLKNEHSFRIGNIKTFNIEVGAAGGLTTPPGDWAYYFITVKHTAGNVVTRRTSRFPSSLYPYIEIGRLSDGRGSLKSSWNQEKINEQRNENRK